MNKCNLKKSVDSLNELFKYLKVGQLNDHMLNVLQAENRTLDFHKHENSDELFYVIEGTFKLEFENEIFELSQGDFFIVPKNTMHRPVCEKLVKVLLIEKEGTLNKENTGGAY